MTGERAPADDCETDAEGTETIAVCQWCGTPRSELGIRPQFVDHLLEEHPAECIEWFAQDWKRNMHRAMDPGTSATHDPLWEFTDHRVEPTEQSQDREIEPTDRPGVAELLSLRRRLKNVR